MNYPGQFSQECCGQAQGSLETVTPIFYREMPDLDVSGLSPRYPVFSLVTSYFAGSRISIMDETLKNEDSEDVNARRQELPRVLRPEEVKRLLAAANPVEAVIVEFYLRTGLRLSEGIHVKVSDLDFEARTVFVRKGKWGKDRVVPFDPQLKYILQDYIQKYGLVSNDYLLCVKQLKGRPSLIGSPRPFHRTVSHYCKTHIAWLVNRLAVVAGLQTWEPFSSPSYKKRKFRVHPHLLRHTALTMIQEAGGDPFVTKEIAGHSNIAMTQIYVHLAIERKREVMEKAFKSIDIPIQLQQPPQGPAT